MSNPKVAAEQPHAPKANAVRLEIRSCLLLASLVGLGGSLFLIAHVRVNFTASIPRGLYFARHGEAARVGSVVSFCPPRNVGHLLLNYHLALPGYCPGGTTPLAKRVVALSPFLCATTKGLFVDGTLHPWPALSLRVADAFPRVATCGPTPARCAFVLGDSADSIDSRVFGCVDSGRIESVLTPLFPREPRP